MERNRAEGWKHAKLSGHENEDLVTEFVFQNEAVQKKLVSCAGKSGVVTGVVDGGLYETGVPSILGDKTKSKPDLRLTLSNGDHVNISIKKSLAGQVYLLPPERFIDGFEKQFKSSIPVNVKRAILLFFGKDPHTLEYVKRYSTYDSKVREYELRKWRLVKATMDRIDPQLCIDMRNWFRDNIVQVFEFCFVRGLAKNPSDWADVIWYKNFIKGEEDGNKMFDMQELKDNIWKHRNLVEFGTRTGGSTLQLPFGFLQYHNPPKNYPEDNYMQFHHKFELLNEL